MKRVLFLCVHNSARSQIAEAYLKLLGGDGFHVESAGFEPGPINPLVVEVMAEVGVDLTDKGSQKVFDLFREGRVFDYVITVCEESEGSKCPIFPGMTHRLHLAFEDPAAVTGTREERLAQVRAIRDAIRKVVEEFISWVGSSGRKPLGDFWEIKPTA
ncbi:Glutaredoxin arsenate reductase [Fundidesulfovibrio magnetotacticus]|uniref:Glutaredoxin arsenate reductase n=1 Tax=Fundidesulfovibrio magnetotacticus TaxID=2730080 RepID=A0A6V8M2T9_9BACT|nr:arsenate reductase ArsC [Fundidesulfovibrio magnetotacticus]GFK96127.1 Glutaredoxin arsenate reductase [Fundidesulfovibrio magnetotacticus]